MASWEREPPLAAVPMTAYRYSAVGQPPLWSGGPRVTRATQPSGRWHREGDGYAQYFALSLPVLWAELARAQGLTGDATRDIHVTLWMARVEEPRIANLGTFDALAACGLDPGLTIADNCVASRALADELRDAGYTGVIAPSAALPGGQCLTLLGERRPAGAHETVPATVLGRYVTIEQVARNAYPDVDEIAAARLLGTPHAEFEQWQRCSQDVPGNERHNA